MSGQETEVKFFVNNLPRIEMCLQSLKAHLIQERVHEINLRFDTPTGSLRKEFKVLRLRKDTEAKFTYKGPSEERTGGVLTRREVEFTVSNFEAAKEFLELLGYTPIVFYEKYRTTYEYNNIHIMLDELPYGTFVEIEGENIERLQDTAHQLGLHWNNMVKAGYHALFERAALKYNLTPGNLSFNAIGQTQIQPQDLQITPADIEE